LAENLQRQKNNSGLEERMKIPPRGASENLIVTMITGAILISVLLVTLLIFIFLPIKPNTDKPYTNEQVVEKAKNCRKQGQDVRMVYSDDYYSVYAVLCVDRRVR
jgi:hypothetical protein